MTLESIEYLTIILKRWKKKGAFRLNQQRPNNGMDRSARSKFRKVTVRAPGHPVVGHMGFVHKENLC